MKPTPHHIQLQRFAALLPVSEDGPVAAPTNHPITTLAASREQADELALAAGLVILHRIDADGNPIPDDTP